MATTIIIIILILISLFAIQSYLKKITRGCCGGEVSIDTSTKDVNNYPFTRDVLIAGMSCRNCATKIENTFNKDEEYYVQVDFESNKARIKMKHNNPNINITTKIEALGYIVKQIN